MSSPDIGIVSASLACTGMLALAARLGVLMGIILMLLPGIAAPVVPAFGLMNGSTFAAYSCMILSSKSSFQMRDVLCVMVASRMR